MNFIGSETVDIIVSDIVDKGLVVTGALRDSVRYELIENPGDIDITFRMIYYGDFLDKGTIYIDPYEFFEVNIKNQLDKYSNDIATAFVNDSLKGLI